MMTEPDRMLLSKASVEAAPGRTPSTGGLPPVLAKLAVKRVRVLAIVVLWIMATGWILENVLQGDIQSDLRYFGEWGAPVFMIVASIVMIVLARMPRVSVESVLIAALVYEVAMSWGIVLSSYWGAFQGMPASGMTEDIVGLTGVALWMLFFTVVVPTAPRRAAAALVLSAAAVPVIYLLEVRAGRAPSLPAGEFFWIFVSPYLGVCILAYITARIVYRLGQDVSRAREMGSYRLVERLGVGGMGEVWRANHRMLARPAAIKLIHQEVLGPDSGTAEAMLARFEREAQVTASLQSPHTVELYDYGTTEDGVFHYVMELLEGVDLERLVRRFGPLPPERVVHILRQVCASLGEAHRRGLVHRDIKPANIYLCERAFEHDFVKVLDFGLVKWHAKLPSEEDLHLSQTGTIHGTPSYMAPEIALGKGPVDGRADLYTLGCVAYWLLTGKLVFEEKNFPAMLLAHANEQPVPPSGRSDQAIPGSLDAIVLSCLAKDPADRVQTAEDLATRLVTVELAQPWTQERAAEWWSTHGAGVNAPEASARGD
jgi:serine/threonine-protein kinase